MNKELSNEYIECMAIGAKLNELSELKEKTKDWYGSETCRAFVKIIHSAVNFKIKEITIEELFKNIITSINEIEIGNYDKYTRGFLAGEILGKPTKENLKLASKAENIWAENYDYGYYQEVLNEVKNGKD